jgi:hypothetical protein
MKEMKEKEEKKERVITVDRFLSIWIFLYTIAYFIGIVPYNPVILISIAVSFFIFSLFFIVPRLNERSLFTYYITINTLGKIIPLLFLINRKITTGDIIFTVFFILFYIAYMFVATEDDIVCIYTDYVEFIIHRDKASEGAIFHEINKAFPNLF